MEVLNTTGEICRDIVGAKTELAPVFRGKHKRKQSKRVQIKKKLSGVNVVIDVAGAKSGKMNISVETDKDGIRATLFDGNTEIESLMLKDKKASFKKLDQTSYRIRLEKKGAKIGDILLSTRHKR
jgi:hypothetical protein